MFCVTIKYRVYLSTIVLCVCWSCQHWERLSSLLYSRHDSIYCIQCFWRVHSLTSVVLVVRFVGVVVNHGSGSSVTCHGMLWNVKSVKISKKKVYQSCTTDLMISITRNRALKHSRAYVLFRRSHRQSHYYFSTTFQTLAILILLLQTHSHHRPSRDALVYLLPFVLQWSEYRSIGSLL